MSKKTKPVISVVGAREHNLKNIAVDIPKNTLTVITGPSGSGKSTLALDILYTEGKRRYTESLSTYARQFLGVAKKPDVDQINGLCPAIAIEQKTVGANPRSTVGTITEIYDYLRVLFARIGKPHCPTCKKTINQESPERICSLIYKQYANQEITMSAPLVHEKKGEFSHLLEQHFKNGLYRFIIDGRLYRFRSLEEIQQLRLKKTYKHAIDIILDVLIPTEQELTRIQEAIEKSFQIAHSRVKISTSKETQQFSSERMCITCAQSFPELEPRLFSFNSPIGACPGCAGIGIVHEWPWKSGDPNAWKAEYPEFFSRYATIKNCSACNGKRLNEYALAVTVANKTIDDIVQMSIEHALAFFKKISLDEHERTIAHAIIKELVNRLTFLYNVGLPYLTLARTARTLSGGEGQRIRLATQIGSALSGVLYILDEPSIGLHQRDNARLIKTLKSLRDQGNTVIVVEHDLDTIRSADHVIDMGPAAGIHGGTITATGTPKKLAHTAHSLTGAFLSGKKFIAREHEVRAPRCFMAVHQLTKNNLKESSVKFPLGVLCGVSGVSGSGKSSLVMQELTPALERQFKKPYNSKTRTYYQGGSESYIEGAQSLAALVVIDQTPIGRTPRSNPATYLGIFDDIRQLFAQLPESNARGYGVGRFSFNVAEGRCFECRGDGEITLNMHFLPEVTVACKSCHGMRYNKQTLEILYKGKNIYQILQMTAFEAREFFSAHNSIRSRLQLLCDVGLDYITLGQPATTLSGGEAQRVKLVRELAKRGANTLYILDEPTTGLHCADIQKLLIVLNRLVDKGNSVIVIEHNLDILKTVDYLIDLGPEGGDRGGHVIAHGTPAHVSTCEHSHTGQFLRQYFS